MHCTHSNGHWRGCMITTERPSKESENQLDVTYFIEAHCDSQNRSKWRWFDRINGANPKVSMLSVSVAFASLSCCSPPLDDDDVVVGPVSAGIVSVRSASVVTAIRHTHQPSSYGCEHASSCACVFTQPCIYECVENEWCCSPNHTCVG
jgi:hypothetical protein